MNFSVLHKMHKDKPGEKTITIEASSMEDAEVKMLKTFKNCKIISIKQEKTISAENELDFMKQAGEPKEDVVVFSFDAGYHVDKDGRVRIPTHERKKVFRAMYPKGSIIATTPGLNRELKEAKGNCEIRLDYNDNNPIAVAEAFCSYAELKSQGFDPVHYPETAETQSVGRALTNLSIPQYLDEIEDETIIKKLDKTNQMIIDYLNKKDEVVISGSIKINKSMQINITSDIREVTGFEKGDLLDIVMLDDELKIIKSITGSGKKVQSNYRFLLGKSILDYGYRMGTFEYTIKDGELCLLKKIK